MKNTLLLIFIFLCFANGYTQFVGAYDLSNWTLTNNNPNSTASVNLSGAPNSFIFTGSDSHSLTSNPDLYDDFEIDVPSSTTISFDYDFPRVDIENFEYVINGNSTHVTSGGSGSLSIPVSAGDTFAFRIVNFDDCCGAGVLTISNFNTSFDLSISSQTNVACSGDSTGAITISASGGTSPYTYLWDDPAAQTTASATGLPVGTYSVTVTDDAGLMSSTTATITLEDDDILPSVITQDLTLELDANGVASITAAEVDNGSADNCGVDNLALDVTTFDCSNLGQNTVTLTVTDTSGNEASETAIVTVIDVSGPVLVTQNITVNLDKNASVDILPSDVLSSVEDNCTTSQDITLSLDQDTFTAIGIYVVNLTSTDASGNSTTITAQVTVDDTLSIKDVNANSVVKLYPNPTSGELFFEVTNAQLENISIYDINGRLIKTSKNLSLNVSDLSSGVYFAKVAENNKTFKVLRFVKK